MENKELSFWVSAFNWNDSVSPKIIGRTMIFCVLSIITTYFCLSYPSLNWSVGPLEFSGAVLGLLMIIRINAGYDRWWEARKLWGGIVNQSRNLAITGVNYGVQDIYWQRKFVDLVSQFPFFAAQVLRGEIQRNEAVICSNELAYIIGEDHRKGKINGFVFQIIEKQRSQLVDYLGGCERILKTPIPKVLDIKVRRFLLFYLPLVPMGLAHKAGWYTPAIMFLLSYSLLALDQIGIELQNPFSRQRLSALPLDEITKGIESVSEMLLDTNHLKKKFYSIDVPLAAKDLINEL